MASVIGGYGVPTKRGESIYPIGEILLCPGESVQEQERPPARASFGDGEIDVSQLNRASNHLTPTLPPVGTDVSEQGYERWASAFV